MAMDPSIDDPLLTAIADLRAQINRLLDAEACRSACRSTPSAEPAVRIDERLPAAAPALKPARMMARPVSSVPPFPRIETAPQPAVPATAPASTPTPAPAPAPTTTTTTASPPADFTDDPRQRLDALAERLAERRKLAQNGRPLLTDGLTTQTGA